MLKMLAGWSWSSVLLTLLLLLIVYYMVPILFPKMPNVPGPTRWPVFGTLLASIRKGIGRADLEYINKYGRVYRILGGHQEALVVADVDILKQILVKDFGNFTNRRKFNLRHGIFKKGLFDAEDSNWRRLRQLLTPSFTSGRLKKILPLVETCCDKLLQNMRPMAEKKEAIEMKMYSGAFTMDVIATSAFGLELDSQKDPNNAFITHAKKLFDFQFTNPIILLILFVPFSVPIMQKLGLALGPKSSIEFLSAFLERTIKERKEQKTRREDFLQLLLDAENQELDEEGKADLQGIQADDVGAKGLTFEEIVAQCFLFFLAAYDTTSSTMSFMLYNLAENPDVQDKVYQELQEVLRVHKEPNYEALSKLTYMEQCIQETLRMYPPATRVDRRSRKDMDIKGLHIPADTIVNIPIYALHHDPEYWSEPDKFDPDRFSPEAKSSRSQFCYLPFGLGPRQCIGIRLAQMEMKLAFVRLLQTFKFTSGKVPLDLSLSFFVRSKSGIWVTPELRE